jgi:hypothetical protein
MKAKWSTLPPDVQTYVAQRDKETHAAITQAGQKLKAFEQQVKDHAPLSQLIEAHADTFRRRGVTPAQGLAVLLEAQRRLDAAPKAGLVEIGRMYGIDLRSFLQPQAPSPQASQPQAVAPQSGQPPSGEQPPADRAVPDPATAQLVEALRAELRQTTQRLAVHESRVNAQEQAESQARSAAVQRAVAAFGEDKPYFAEVKPLMAALLNGGQAKDLADAYDMAVNADRDIRLRIQTDQRQAEEEKRAAGARTKADQARRAAAVNVRSGPAAVNPKTMDDTLNEIARRRYG